MKATVRFTAICASCLALLLGCLADSNSVARVTDTAAARIETQTAPFPGGGGRGPTIICRSEIRSRCDRNQRSKLLVEMDSSNRHDPNDPHVKAINRMLRAGVPIDIHAAAGLGLQDQVEALLAGNQSLLNAVVSGRTPLAVAVENGQLAMVRWLLKAGADPNMGSPDWVPAVEAVYTNSAVIFDELIKQGAKPPEDRGVRRRALAEALEKDSPQLIHRLIETNGFSPDPADRAELFFLAIDRKDVEMVELLADRWSIQEPKLLSEALYQAVGIQHLDTVEFLLRRGAPVNDRHNSGATPLGLAAYCGDTRLVALLLRHGADATIPDDEGHTPAWSAEALGHDDALWILARAHK